MSPKRMMKPAVPAGLILRRLARSGGRASIPGFSAEAGGDSLQAFGKRRAAMGNAASESLLAGGCHCGKVRYEAHGRTFHPTICHCVDCRRVVGAPCVAWFSVERHGFRIVAGEMRRYASSARAERGFCADCGTSLTFQAHDLPGEIDVTTASLDNPERVPPADHTRTARRLGWMRFADGLPAYPGTRAKGATRVHGGG
jgi:hypothetical protein